MYNFLLNNASSPLAKYQHRTVQSGLGVNAQNADPFARCPLAEAEDVGRMYHRDCDVSSFLCMSACIKAGSNCLVGTPGPGPAL